MTENPLTTAVAQVSALLAEVRERGEAATEQAQSRLAETAERTQSRLAETAEKTQSRLAETAENTQARIDDALATALALFEEARVKLSSLPIEVPAEIEELRNRFSPEELRSVAEAYLAVAAGLLTSLSDVVKKWWTSSSRSRWSARICRSWRRSITMPSG